VEWKSTGRLRVGGHRGASALAPENTMASFRLAASVGCDYLELDVRLTADRVPVVFHDDALERTTNGSGTVEALPLRALRALDAGGWFGPAFAGEHVPLLAEVLVLVESLPRLGATIEAKGAGTGAAIARAIRRSPAATRLSVCSFEPSELVAAAAFAPEVPRLLILDRDDPTVHPIAAAGSASATGVNVPAEWCDEAMVARFHAAGLLVAGGTVDDETTLARVLAVGIDVADSNRPDLIVPAAKRLFLSA
jgi:glycerophosphoryl diester phosphodiesterase